VGAKRKKKNIDRKASECCKGENMNKKSSLIRTWHFFKFLNNT
jgi:hypothetical protein